LTFASLFSFAFLCILVSSCGHSRVDEVRTTSSRIVA
jgi:hypothetical protein